VSKLARWSTNCTPPNVWAEPRDRRPAGRWTSPARGRQRLLFARLRVHLAGWTKTPGDCFHGLSAGAVSGMHGDPVRGMSPWFPASILTGAKVCIPHREYMLFRGHLDDVGHWGATDPATGSSRDEELPAPHLLWPADHRWFVATDVDSDFTWAWRVPGAHRRGHHRSEARRRARSPQLNAPDRFRQWADRGPQIPVNWSTCLQWAQHEHACT
jgi:hypothetical protein